MIVDHFTFVLNLSDT